MTDDDELSERLARLQARRSSAQSSGRAPKATAAAPDVPQGVGVQTSPTVVRDSGGPAAAPSRRRRSPAATAKIVTVGVSTTAVLGLLAGYGYEDVSKDGPQLIDAFATASPTAVDEWPVVPAAPTTPPGPQVIIVLVDATTGERLVTTAASTREAALATALDAAGLVAVEGQSAHDQATSGQTITAPDTVIAQPAPVPTPDTVVAQPAPVPVPTAVDLAVPAPPLPPAPPQPAPAPNVQASSGGS